MAAVTWTDEIDDVLGGDLTAALAYVTPARGAVVTAVAPIGLPDPNWLEGTVQPQSGAEPRVDVQRAAKRLAALPHRLIAWRGADGLPVVAPFSLGDAGAGGIDLSAPGLPPGRRRAGVLAHRYNAQLIGLATRQHTGWLTAEPGGGRRLYAPHTEQGFAAPANKRLLLLGNGFLAKRNLKRARAAGAAA